MIDGGCGCALGRIEQMIRRTFWEAGAEGFVVGVSGGIDSAVAAALCVRAVGPDRVLALSLPSAVSAAEDLEDARELCRLLGCEHRTIAIEPVLNGFRAMPAFPASFIDDNSLQQVAEYISKTSAPAAKP